MIREVWFVFLSFASALSGEVRQYKFADVGFPFSDLVYPVRNGVVAVRAGFTNVGSIERLRRSAEEDDRDVENYKSDREEPREVPTRPDYKGKGHWAKGSLPNGKEIDVGFIPQKVYTQVRKYDTVKHLPRTAAAQEATTYEEMVNAPRLREVLSQKKIQQVYEEEGYEDSGYDHGGYNHHGAKEEDIEKHEDLSAQKRQPDNDAGSAQNLAVVSGKSKNSTSVTGKAPGGVRWKRFHTETQTKKLSWDDDVGNEGSTKSVAEEIDEVTRPFVKDHESVTAKAETNSTNSAENKEVVVSNTTGDFDQMKNDGRQINGSWSIEGRGGELNIDMIETAESHRSHSAIHEEPSGRSLEARVINDPRPKGSGMVTFPGRHTRRQYAVGRPVDVYVQESVGYGVRRPVYGVPVTPSVHHYLPLMPAFPSFYSDNPAAFTAPVISQRLPVKPVVSTSPPTLPPASTSVEPILDTGPVKFLNAADTLNAYANLLQQSTTSANKPVLEEQNYADIIQPRFNSTLDVDISASTRNEKHNNGTSSRRRPSRFRHPISNGRGKQYNNFTRVSTNYQNESGPSGKSNLELKNPSPHTRHPSLPRDSSEDGSSHTLSTAAHVHRGRPPPMQRPQDPVKYIESLTIAHFSNGANVPVSQPSVQNERLKELARQLNARSIDSSGKYMSGIRRRRMAGIEYDSEKYPFYDSFRGISKDSALRYATNPDDLPKKSPGGMEFYESKDRLVKCDEPKPPDDIVPERAEDGEWNENPQPQNFPRMKGLGDSIDCLKVRYFGADPLDNPFFKEGPIGGPPMYEMEKHIKDHIRKHQRKVREIDENKRLMIIPPREDNSSQLIYNNNYTHSQAIRGEERSNGHTSFPYRNHKPESAEVSPSVHNLRATSPYKFYSEHDDDSYFPTYEANDDVHDSDSDDSKRHKYYHHNFKHKYVHKKKKRTRPPPYHYHPRPLPVSIYSVIAGSKSYPLYRRPILYASSSNVNRVIPIYHYESTPPSDSYVSDSKSSYQTTPTKWYIVRPGEYTENKDIAVDSKPASSSIWNYINPLRWWFPSYFDERRGEPKHRRRRSSEQELFNKILARTNNASLESRVFGNYKSSSSDKSRYNKPDTTTGQPISIEEFKARINSNGDKSGKTSSKINRLTGGFISRTSFSTMAPSTSTLSAVSYGENLFGMVTHSTTPIPMSSLNADVNPTSPSTPKPKVLFPRTRTPSKRRPHPTKSNINAVSRNSLTTTTTTTTSSTTPSTTTRMYKPKRIIRKKFDKNIPVDAFPVLRRSNPPSNQSPQATPSPFDSIESSAVESASIEEPRRLQQVEHRRVTKEEVIKTSYIPEEGGHLNKNIDDSSENYFTSNSKSGPVTDPTLEQDNHTLTYMLNPVTGVGSWGEHPRRTTWKPTRRYPKRHLDNKFGYKSTYSYPPIGLHDPLVQGSTPNRNRKRHSAVSQYDSQAYIAGLMNQARPSPVVPRSTRFANHLKSVDSLSRNLGHPHLSSDEIKSYVGGSVEIKDADSGGEENYPPPTKSPPKFIMDPGKRKYFYVKAR